jgi:hypothetical protein
LLYKPDGRVGVIGFEPIQPKHWIYSPARLSTCGAPPLDINAIISLLLERGL